MTTLSIDLESRSACDLKKHGAYVYWEDETTDLWCACYAFNDEPVQTWRPGEPCPPRITAHVEAGGLITGWNVAFERLGWRHRLHPTYGWPLPRLEQFDDTAAAAAAMALPRGLGDAAKALGVDEQKDDEGYRLMLRMSKPRKPRKGEKADAVLWWDDPDRVERLIAYCAKDVEAERAIRRLLVPLSPAERDVYLLDQAMNDRGVRVDLGLVQALLRITDTAKEALDKRMARATGWEVTACSQVSALTGWLKSRGVSADSLAKAAVEDLLASDLPPDCREAVEIRKEAAKTSTAKLTAMQKFACADGRIKGLHLYHGASTGRWSGKGPQFQNLPRGTGTVKDAEAAVPHMLAGSSDLIDFLYGPPMSAVSDMLRSCITASPGHVLMAADYSSIEGRVTAWVAGEHDELEAYRLNDRGEGPGIYEIAASGIFDVPAQQVTKAQRQVGKAAALALGYGGGVLAFKAMADIYWIDMAPVYPILQGVADAEVWERAEKRYDECLERGDTGTDIMGREAWVASEVTKVMWRAKHPATVALWAGLEGAAREAVQQQGTISSYGPISYTVRNGFLWCRLPSGRCLAYGAPKVEDRETPWGDKKPSVTALGVDSVTKKWRRFALYGGLATENCLSGESEVLTEVGWMRIDTVDTSLRVWDGLEFVQHAGLVYQGDRETIDFAGLRLTPDHEVLTHDGWKRAEYIDPEKAPSPITGFSRAAFRAPDRDGICGVEWHEEPVEDEVRVWEYWLARCYGTLEGPDAELWLLKGRGAEAPRVDARHVEAPGLRGLALDARPLPAADAPSVEELRGARDPSVRPLADVPELLGGHGADVHVRLDAGQRGQRRALRAGQLPVGPDEGERAQQAEQRHDQYATRPDADVRSVGADRHRQDDAVVSFGGGLAGGTDARSAGLLEPRVEPVYDLLDCGPRRRFVARGPGGRPFIVHNCVQAIARDLMANGMLKAERAGYPIVMTVHDEAVADVEEGFGSLSEFEALLCDLPAWAAGIPLVASGYIARRYRKD